MSVMNQLKSFSENPDGSSGKFSRDFLGNEGIPNDQAVETDDMMQDHPIPGQSLTQDPDSRMPYEGPPEFTDQQDFLEHLFIQLSDQDALPKLLEAMTKQVPIEEIALRILRGQVSKGAINTDLMLLSIEPAIYMLISFATYAEIDPVLYPEGELDDEAANDEMAGRFRAATKEMIEGGEKDETPGVTVQELQTPAALPQSIMKRTQEAVASIQSNPEEPK